LLISPLPRRHGVGPAHSREVPLPLTRDEIGTLDFESVCDSQGAYEQNSKTQKG